MPIHSYRELNKEIKYSSSGNNTKIELEKINSLYSEIYIRRILNRNIMKNEIFNTLSIIGSNYELVNGTISYEKEKIIIDIPKIQKNEYYSVLINILRMNEKFVYDTIFYEGKNDSDSDNTDDSDNKDDSDNNDSDNSDDDNNSDNSDDNDNAHKDGNDHKVLIIVSVVLPVLIIIGIVVLLYFKNKRKNLQNIVMKTSFDNSGVLDELNDISQ